MNKYVIAGSLAVLLTVALGVGIYLLVSGDSGLREIDDSISQQSSVPAPAAESPVEVTELSEGSVRIGDGKLKIVGKVVDGAGDALAGAEVILFEATGDLERLLDNAIFEDRDEVARRVRDRARSLLALTRRRPRVASDAEGSFVFEGLSRGVYRVAALGGTTADRISHGLSPSATDVLVLDEEFPQSTVSLELNSGASIRGVVITPRLDPVGDARVRVSWRPDDDDLAIYRGASGEEVLAILLTPEAAEVESAFDGSFAVSGLLDGEYTLTAEAEGHARALLRDVPTDGPEIQVVLEPELIVYGEVIDEEENPIAGAEVELAFVSSDAGDIRSVFRSGLKSWRGFARRKPGRGDSDNDNDDGDSRRSETLHRTLTDSEGSFEIRGLAKGTYRAEAEREGYQKGLDPFFSISQESSDEDRILIFQLAEGHVIEGIVLDENGAPVGDIEVRLRREGDLPSEEQEKSEQADAGGRRDRGDDKPDGEARENRKDRGDRRGFGGRGGGGGRGGRGGGRGRGGGGEGRREGRSGGQGPVGSPGIQGMTGLTTAVLAQETPEDGRGGRDRGRGDRGGGRGGERRGGDDDGQGRGRGDRGGERGGDRRGGDDDGRDRDRGDRRFMSDLLERFTSVNERYENRTGGDGRFKFTTLPPGIYRIEIRSSRFLTYTQEGIETDGEALEIRLEGGKAIRGRVVDAESSQPIPNASVLLYAPRTRRGDENSSRRAEGDGGEGEASSTDSDEDSRRERGRKTGGFRGGDSSRRGEGSFKLVRTDAEGRFVAAPLSGDTYTLRVSARGYLRTDGPDVEAGAKEEVEVSLDRSGLVRGRVLDANGLGVAGLRVALARDRSSETDGEEGRRGFERLGGRGGGRTEYVGRSVTSDSEGAYSLSPDRPATVRVVVSGDPYLPGQSEPLIVDDPTMVIENINIVVQRSGTVVGTVTGSSGLPLARATVEVRPRPEESATESENGETDFRERLRKRFESFRGGVSTRTDATGHYEATGLEEGRYELRVRASGHLDLSTEPFFISLGEEKPVDVELEAEQYLAGTVRMRDGTPIESAEVTTVTERERTERGRGGDFFRRNQRAVTSATGAFRLGKLERATYDLRAVAKGYASTMMHNLSAPAEKIEIVLDPLVHLSGVVLGASTRLPVSSFRIRLVSENEDQLDRRERESLGRWRSFDGPEGVFLLENLPPGSFVLQVDAPEYLPVSGLALTVSPGVPIENFVVYVPEGGVIAGLVVDSRGQAVPGARVEAQMQSIEAESGKTSYSGYRSSLSSSRGSSRGPRDRGSESSRGSTERSRGSTSSRRGSPRSGRSYSLEDGTFLVRGLPDGVYRILVTHSDLISAEEGDFVIQSNADGSSSLADVRVVLKDGATVRGRVLGLSGDARAFVSLRTGTSSKSAVIDATGRFELRGLPPGSYELQARLFGGRSSSRRRGGDRGESSSSTTVTLPIEIGEKDTVIDNVNVSFK